MRKHKLNLVDCIYFLTLLAFPIERTVAAEVDGYSLPDTLSGDTREVLYLNGCGLRELIWSDLYLVGLYLPQKALDRSTILDPTTTKTVRLEIVYDNRLPEDLPASWREPLREQVSQEMLELLQDLYDTVATGDVILFHYSPGSGTTIHLNENLVTRAGDATLINTLLTRWIGAEPVSLNLRRLLLSGNC